MEKKVGAELAGYVSGYISAAHFGVTEMELLDLLSCNNEALLLALPPDMMSMLRFPHWYWLAIKNYIGEFFGSAVYYPFLLIESANQLICCLVYPHKR